MAALAQLSCDSATMPQGSYTWWFSYYLTVRAVSLRVDECDYTALRSWQEFLTSSRGHPSSTGATLRPLTCVPILAHLRSGGKMEHVDLQQIAIQRSPYFKVSLTLCQVAMLRCDHHVVASHEPPRLLAISYT